MQSRTAIEQGPIPAETIYEMIGAAMNIPTVALGQPTQFVVLNEVESLSRASEIVPLHPLTKQALAAIVVCGDLKGAEIKDKWMFDCETAVQQLMLAAHASGLGAYNSSIYPDRDRIYGMTVMLGLPDHIVAHSYVAMGYPTPGPGAGHDFSNQRIHYNNWVRKNG